MAFTKQNKRYERSGYFAARTPYEAAQALQRGGYATDPNYANSLAAVIKGRKIDPMRPVVIKPTGSIDDGTGFRGGISRDTQVKAQQSYAVARQAILNDNRLTAAQKQQRISEINQAAFHYSQYSYNGSKTDNGNDITGFSGPNPLANANVKITPNSRMGKAIAWMAKNCGATSKHRCAAYVASALIAGGFKVNRQQSAYMYHRNGELARLGFKLVAQTTQAGISSISKVGDVIVWDRCPSSPVHGHIAINVGTRVHPKGYCSDFFHGTGVYGRPGAVYVYRHPENANGEVISVSGNGNFAVPQQVANNKPQNIEGKETGDSQAKKPKPKPMPKQNTVSKSTLGGVPKIQTGSKSTGDLKGLDAKTSLKNALAKSQSGENEVHHY